jgi:hypothetical protein
MVLNEEIEKIASLKLAREIERINSEIEKERQEAIGDLNRRGALQSGMTIAMMKQTGLRRVDELLRANFDCLKDAVSLAGRPLSSEVLRELAERAEAVLQNTAQSLSEEIQRKFHGLATSMPELNSDIGREIENVRARFQRDVAIEATEAAIRDSAVTAQGAKVKFSSSRLSTEFEYDVFVSFTTADRAVGDRIHDLLSERGVRVFYSPKDLQSGDHWAEIIRVALLKSSEVCLVVSLASLGREWVLTEWGAAWALDRRITPILVDCKIGDLPQRLQAKQCVRLQELDHYIDEVTVRSKQG